MIAMIASPKCVILLSCFAVALGVGTDSMAQARTPQILEVSRDYLKPEAVAANRKLERRAEGLCRTLGFTHPYLTISDHRVCLRTRGDVVPQWVRLGSHSGEAQAGVSAEYEITGGPDDITRQKVPLKRLESPTNS